MTNPTNIIQFNPSTTFLNIEKTNEYKISRVLNSVGIHPSSGGFHYIKKAVLMIMDDPSYIELITKRLYLELAKEVGKKPICIERSIRYAINGIECNEEILITYFGYYRKHYTNKEFLAGVAEYVSLN